MLERPWYRHPFWQGFARAAASRFVAFTYLFGMGVYVGIALARNQTMAAWLMSLAALAYGALYARWQWHMLRDAVNEVMRSAQEEARDG